MEASAKKTNGQQKAYCDVCDSAFVEGRAISEKTFYVCSMCRADKTRVFADNSPEVAATGNDFGND